MATATATATAAATASATATATATASATATATASATASATATRHHHQHRTTGETMSPSWLNTEQRKVLLAIEAAALRETTVAVKLAMFEHELDLANPNIHRLREMAAELTLMDHRQEDALMSMFKL